MSSCRGRLISFSDRRSGGRYVCLIVDLTTDESLTKTSFETDNALVASDLKDNFSGFCTAWASSASIFVLSIVQGYTDRIKQIMTPSAATNQTLRRSTRRQPDATSNGVSKNTPSAKNSEGSKTIQSLKSTKDSSLKTVKHAEQIVKSLPSSREDRFEAEAEGSGSSLSDLDFSPEEDSAPDLKQIQSRCKSGERSESLVKVVKVVEEQALGAEFHKPKHVIKEQTVKVEQVLVAPKINISEATSRKRKVNKLSIEEEDEKLEVPEDVEDIAAKPNQRKKTKRREDIADGGELPEKPIRKRKTKEAKEPEIMPLAARTNGMKMFVGAHVSSAKGPSSKYFLNHEHLSLYIYIEES